MNYINLIHCSLSPLGANSHKDGNSPVELKQFCVIVKSCFCDATKTCRYLEFSSVACEFSFKYSEHCRGIMMKLEEGRLDWM